MSVLMLLMAYWSAKGQWTVNENKMAEMLVWKRYCVELERMVILTQHQMVSAMILMTKDLNLQLERLVQRRGYMVDSEMAYSMVPQSQELVTTVARGSFELSG